MVRFADWPMRLHRFYTERAQQKKAWGVNDCALTAFGAIECMTGMDLGSPFRGKYFSERESLKVIHSFGATSFENAIEIIFAEAGMQEAKVLFARRGDVVLADSPEGATLGIVYLEGHSAMFVTDHGITATPLRNCRRAWRV